MLGNAYKVILKTYVLAQGENPSGGIELNSRNRPCCVVVEPLRAPISQSTRQGDRSEDTPLVKLRRGPPKTIKQQSVTGRSKQRMEHFFFAVVVEKRIQFFLLFLCVIVICPLRRV